MDIFVTNNLKKGFIISVFAFLALCVMGCPSNDNCDDMGSSTQVNDLITLLPEQTEYNQGDVVTLKLTIPSVNTYFGFEVDLFEETNDNSALLVLAFNQLFLDNELVFISGRDGESTSNNWYDLIYNEDLDTYELEVQVTLNRVGQYSLITDDSVVFDGGNCDRYRIITNVLWAGDAVVEFTVNE